MKNNKSTHCAAQVFSNRMAEQLNQPVELLFASIQSERSPMRRDIEKGKKMSSFACGNSKSINAFIYRKENRLMRENDRSCHTLSYTRTSKNRLNKKEEKDK